MPANQPKEFKAPPRAAFATDPDRSRGRLHDEPPSATRTNSSAIGTGLSIRRRSAG